MGIAQEKRSRHRGSEVEVFEIGGDKGVDLLQLPPQLRGLAGRLGPESVRIRSNCPGKHSRSRSGVTVHSFGGGDYGFPESMPPQIRHMMMGGGGCSPGGGIYHRTIVR